MLKFISTYLITPAWHQWRIATLRPAVQHASDTWSTLMPFAIWFVACNVWLWSLADVSTRPPMLFMLFSLATVAGIIVVCRRQGFSLGMPALVLGTLGVVDGATAIGCVQGLLAAPDASYIPVTCKVLLLGRLLRQYSLSPEEVSRRGYRAPQDMTPA